MPTWVKICGVTRPEDARAAFDAGADAIGINFWTGSRRCCRLEAAREIVSVLRPGELAFGVFVRAPRDEVRRIVDEVSLGGVQFHGGESTDDVAGWNVPTIRAVAVSDRLAAEAALAMRDRFLESRGAGYRLLVDHGSGGGSGLAIDDEMLDGLDLADAILAGGLTPRNVADRVARFRPFGVDTAGGVESAPGIKDANAIAEFIREARREQ
ncbi:MAG TPA: phosphoribosylanthranilate isomerase [Candidatus Limnocylindrales bacterium]|nr:phosphoribosylanthranilate isomerase [Candidatus Limnocylindrales bacterium]